MRTSRWVWAGDRADSKHGWPCLCPRNLRAVRTVEVFDGQQGIETQCPKCGARPRQIARCFKLHDGPPPVHLADLEPLYESSWVLPISIMSDEQAAELKGIFDASDAMGRG